MVHGIALTSRERNLPTLDGFLTSIPINSQITSMESNTAEQNKDTWDADCRWFERFDYERSERSEKDTKVKLSDGLGWGFWRRSRGNYCGLDGIGEEGFTVQTYVPKGSPTPIWGTRHGYNKEEIPTVKFKLWAFEQTG